MDAGSQAHPKEMAQKGREGPAGPGQSDPPNTEGIPKNNRSDFIADVVNLYSRRSPTDDHGMFHVRMIRLRVGRRMDDPAKKTIDRCLILLVIAFFAIVLRSTINPKDRDGKSLC